jgi:hypothetical protein
VLVFREQLAAALDDVMYGVDLGLRSVLVADIGLLSVLGKLKRAGKLPNSLQIKVSVSMGPMNPVRCRAGFSTRSVSRGSACCISVLDVCICVSVSLCLCVSVCLCVCVSVCL